MTWSLQAGLWFGLSVSDPKVQEGWKKLLNSGGAPNPQVAQGRSRASQLFLSFLVTEKGPRQPTARLGRTGQP